MPVGEWKTLTIRGELKDRLQKSFESDEKKYPKQSFSSWVDTKLDNIVKYEELVREYGAIFEFQTITEGNIIIQDNFSGKHVFVDWQEGPSYLYCEEDNSHHCEHVGCCYEKPIVFEALVRRGLIPKTLEGYLKFHPHYHPPPPH